MLETVRSRRIYGFLVLTILPTSAAIGYYLRERKDLQITEQVTSSSPSTALSSAVVEDRIKMLRRHEAELIKEAKDIREKLQRVKVKEAAGPGVGKV